MTSFESLAFVGWMFINVPVAFFVIEVLKEYTYRSIVDFLDVWCLHKNQSEITSKVYMMFVLKWSKFSFFHINDHAYYVNITPV